MALYHSNIKTMIVITAGNTKCIGRENFILTLITPAPVRANMIQTLVHSCRGLGCSIFIETNVKRQSNPLPFKVCSIQQCTEHIQPSTIISKNDSKKCVHFGTTARVIRVNIVVLHPTGCQIV